MRAAVAEVHPDDTTRYEDRLVRGAGIDLGVGDEPLLRGGHDPRIGQSVQHRGHLAGRGVHALGGGHPQVVHVQHGERLVVRLPPPLGSAPQAGVDPGADTDDERDDQHLHPAAPQVPQRPSEREQHAHGGRRLPVQVADRRPAPLRWPVAGHPTTRQLDDPISHPRDLPVMGHHDDRAAGLCLLAE